MEEIPDFSLDEDDEAKMATRGPNDTLVGLTERQFLYPVVLWTTGESIQSPVLKIEFAFA